MMLAMVWLLPVPGGPKSTKSLPACGRENRRQLGRVPRTAARRCPPACNRRPAFSGSEKSDAVAVGVLGRIDEVADHRVALEQLGPVVEVLPHQVLGEREGREDDVLGHLPTLQVANVGPDDPPDPTDVEARSVGRQVALEFRHPELEILPQQLEQRGIELCLVLVHGEPEPGPHAGPLQRDRNEEERSPARSAAVALRPPQKAQRQEQDVGAAFLERRTGEPEQLGQPGVEFLFRDTRVQIAPLERLEDVAATAVVVMAIGEQLGATLIAVAQHVGPGKQLELRARAQQILKARRIGALERDRLLCVLEVEQLVAKRQVEQPALPCLQPAEPLVVRHLRDHDLLGERGGLVEVERLRVGDAGGHRRRPDVPPPRSSGRIWRARARLMSIASSNGALAPSAKMLGARLHRSREAGRRLGSQHGRLDEDYIIQAAPLAQDLNVVDDCGGEILVLQPQADESVPGDQDQERDLGRPAPRTPRTAD